jgi:Predicted glycosyltransferases
MHLTSIITVNYHQAALTADFLRSIRTFTEQESVEVIVVDNGSKTDNSDLFRSVYPEVVYLRSEKNLGFAGGNNLGINQAKGDYLLFLNNDTEITEGFVGTMRSELSSRPDMGLLSPLILYFDDKRKVQYAGYTPMHYLTGRNSGIGVMDDDLGQYDNVTRETGYCHGAAMMCRRADLDQVGVMEEHFFLYYEELDWCEKFKRAGFKLGFTGKAKIYHKESMSVGKESPLKTYFMVRNRWLFIRRNTSWFTAFLFSGYYLSVAMPFQLLRYLISGKFALAKAAFGGLWWNVTHSADFRQLVVNRR